MKNITLSAQETLIAQARRRADSEHQTLNGLFRQWLTCYVTEPSAADTYDDTMRRLNHVSAGKKISREQMNERR